MNHARRPGVEPAGAGAGKASVRPRKSTTLPAMSWNHDERSGPTQYPEDTGLTEASPAPTPAPSTSRRAHDASRPSSYAFDDALAEHAIRPNHQRENHEDVGREILGAAAHVGVDVPGRHVLHAADDEPADDGARDRVEPTQDHHREHLEADQGEVHVHAEHVAPQHAAQRRDQ